MHNHLQIILDGDHDGNCHPSQPRKEPSFAWRALIPAILCALILGCGTRDDAVVWKEQTKSPDGLWLATADTIQNGGPGNAEIHTTVFLQHESTKDAPQEIFVAECDGPMPHPYALDNNANKGGCIGLSMAWVTPKHLRLTYETRQGTHVLFQVAKLSDVEITIESVGRGPLASSSLY
jgi:hypothetical protein